MTGMKRSGCIDEGYLAKLLRKVSRPGRYAGGEPNIVRKADEGVRLRFALAFPELYEIGMSYPGMQILYHVLNSHPLVSAERVYAPWDDFESELRNACLPLFSLETKRPLSSFDVVGFTLQYELTYTNILNMLSLGRIPLRSDMRGEGDPIIIGGGPGASNPEPLAAFFDAFVIGDGENAIIEIAEMLIGLFAENMPRHDILKKLSSITGVYIPALYREERDPSGSIRIVPVGRFVPYPVKARIEPELRNDQYPPVPVLPNTKPVQDRAAVEIMRGCTQGCRFCQAGYIYRPSRTRPVEEIVAHAERWIRDAGYQEMSVVALSMSDYPELRKLLLGLESSTSKYHTSLSFPSLRSDSFTREMAHFLKTGRFSGLTLALEAATPRLRRVINKNIDEEGVFESIRIAAKNGWKKVKLYFMIGLPTETDEDILAIPALLARIRQSTGCMLHAAISPFIPKPWTPFQWERQNSEEEFNDKIRLIKKNLRDRKIELKWRDPKVSWLEGLLARAGRDMAEVIERAYFEGARFDGWMDHLHTGKWEKALRETGVIAENNLGARDSVGPLPWDHIDRGVTREYLAGERANAINEVSTPDCRDSGCEICGVMDAGDCPVNIARRNIPAPVSEADAHDEAELPNAPESRLPAGKLRCSYRKTGLAVFHSHLDLGDIFRRSLGVSGIPAIWSRGFNARPKISYGPALPTGYGGLKEYFDIAVYEIPDALDDIRNRMQSVLPEGLEITGLAELKKEVRPASALSPEIRYCYEVPVRLPGNMPIEAVIGEFAGKSEINATVGNNGKTRQVNIAPFVKSIEYSGAEGKLRIEMKVIGGKSLKIEPVLDALFGEARNAVDDGIIYRTDIIAEYVDSILS